MNEGVRLYYLQQLGIPVWQSRGTLSAGSTEQPSLDDLAREVAQCQKCDLASSRTQTVFGVGDSSARLMLIGEAPGFHEDKQGQPFVGRAGQLLNAILQSVGIARESVYIANLIKCRPPNNRDPKAQEIAACQTYVKQQIELIQPELIVALGRFAGQQLADSKLTLAKLRQSRYAYGEAKRPLLVTYHPAYLLRNPIDKAKALQDWWQIVSLLKNK